MILPILTLLIAAQWPPAAAAVAPKAPAAWSPAPAVAPHAAAAAFAAAPRPAAEPAWGTSDVDPADSLFRVANERLARGDYKGAAELFRAVRARYPKSGRLGEALYFEAFSLYRAGDPFRARTAIDEMRTRYPREAARGDANALRTRICGELARQGDPSCAEEVARVVSAVDQASAPAAPSAPSPAAAPSAASPARAPSAPMPPAAAAGPGWSRGGASARASRPARASSDCPGGDDDEDDERIAALNALMQMDPDRAVPILSKVLARRDKCSEGLRRKAIFILSQKGGKEVADLLMGAAKGDPDQEVREQAVFWLSQVRDVRAVEMLGAIALDAKAEPALREKALFALSQHRDPKAVETLRTAATDESMGLELREKAIFWIGQHGGAESADFLRGLYRKLGSADLKEKVLFSLSQTRAAANTQFLLGVVEDAKEPLELRKRAIFWLGQMGAEAAQLGTIYAKLGDRELKEQVIFAWSQQKGSVDRLIEVARNEKDRELRKKAIFWIGQSRDPRATQFLAELVDK
jgi:HEAT repeat protein